MNKIIKLVILIVIGGLLLGGLAVAPIRLGALGWRDLLPYWASAHLLATGQNPYDLADIDALTAEVAPGREPIDPAWNPPWLAVALLPLAILPYDAAIRVWLMFNLAAISSVTWLVWQWAARRKRPPIWLPLVGLGFYASLVAVSIGQIVVIILLGLTLCLATLQGGRDVWAGVALVLTLGKPQLIYLIIPLILIWAATQRRWHVWAGLIGAWLLTLVVATILSPNWLTGYLTTTGGHDFFTHLSATIGGVLKAYTGSDALRFVGVLTLLLIPWLLRLIARHDLLTGVNVALLISLPLAPYGWSFDQLVLLPAIVQLTAWILALDRPRRRVCGLLLIAIYVTAFGLKLAGWGDFLFVWVPIALGGLYALVYRIRFVLMSDPRSVAHLAG